MIQYFKIQPIATIGRLLPMRQIRAMRGLSTSPAAVAIATIRSLAISLGALEQDSNLIFDTERYYE